MAKWGIEFAVTDGFNLPVVSLIKVFNLRQTFPIPFYDEQILS